MDILISSNLERLLFDLADGDTALIAQLMAQLSKEGRYAIPPAMKERADALFYGGYADEKDTAAAIKSLYENYDYLMDPHTAVASKVYDNYLAETGDRTPAIILSTASPYKFGHAVYESIFDSIPAGLSDYDVLKALSHETGVPIPGPLKDLNKKANRHDKTCEKAGMPQCIQEFIQERGPSR